MCVSIIAEAIDKDKEKEICLLNNGYLSGHRKERIIIVVSCIVCT